MIKSNHPTDKKSTGVMYGKWVGQFIGPPWPVQCFSNAESQLLSMCSVMLRKLNIHKYCCCKHAN